MQNENKFEIESNPEMPDKNLVRITLSPASANGPLIPAFEKHFQLAMMAADREPLADGGLKLAFVLNAQECDHLREALNRTWLDHSQFYCPN